MNWHWYYMDILNMSNWVDYDMKFPKKCPHCKQTFYAHGKHTFTLSCEMLNKFTGEGSGMGALFGWAGLEIDWAITWTWN